MKNDDDTEWLDQYDYGGRDTHTDKVHQIIAPLIGEFLIYFSELEHDLNIAIADIVSLHSHETGYLIVERMNFSSKIDLYYRLHLAYLAKVSYKRSASKKVYVENLGRMRKQIEQINSLRNSIVHADWVSIKRDGNVRVKILTDGEEGRVRFRTSKFSQKQLKSEIIKLHKFMKIFYEFNGSIAHYKIL